MNVIAKVAGPLLALGAAGMAQAQMTDPVGPAPFEMLHRYIEGGWKNADEQWKARLMGDETMKACTRFDNNPPAQIFQQIAIVERAKIVYPPDGNLVGDWRKGQKLAQSGYGMRFTDYPPRQETGGNCYACHQLSQEELSYGTLGPSLLSYGRMRNFNMDDVRAVYDKIYNSHAVAPCSNMPRFGTNQILTIEQIKDIVAYVMSPESPVNK